MKVEIPTDILLIAICKFYSIMNYQTAFQSSNNPPVNHLSLAFGWEKSLQVRMFFLKPISFFLP